VLVALRTVCVTRREFSVACELAWDGAGNSAIGERLGMSSGTVKTHIHGLLRKTDCANRAELAVKVARGVIALRPVRLTPRP
jgi:DNA-binding NarL/FixJ family response regulator